MKSATADHEAHLVEEELKQWRREKELEKKSRNYPVVFLMTCQKNMLSAVVIKYKTSKKKFKVERFL